MAESGLAPIDGAEQLATKRQANIGDKQESSATRRPTTESWLDARSDFRSRPQWPRTPTRAVARLYSSSEDKLFATSPW